MNTYNADKAHRALAKVFSSVRLIGPPMNDKLVEMIANLFSAEEAKIVVHAPFYFPGSLEKIAKKAGVKPEQARFHLDAASSRRVMLNVKNRYSLLPVLPGIFEYALINGKNAPWQQTYAKQIVELFLTGYIKQYLRVKIPGIRTLPVDSTINPGNHIVDADLISTMIDYHSLFAVANVCQCRQSMRFAGQECKRAAVEDGCLIFGRFAAGMEKSGIGRLVTREEMRTIVAERWSKNLVFLTANVSVESPNVICTCCDCCCHGLGTINRFQGMALMAAPHYLAVVDKTLCNHCGKCIKACNTLAHTMTDKIHSYDFKKCIGCGLCVDQCSQGAITLTENPAYKPPAKNFKALSIRLLPGILISGLMAKLERLKL